MVAFVRFSLVPFFLLGIPILEIAVFITVGQQIGVLPTLALILVTAIAGSILLRVQGFGVLARIRQTMDAGRMPGRELVHGVMILVAGVLLLTPGFVTDTLGFLLFIPAIRDLGWNLLKDRIVVMGAPGEPGPQEPPWPDDRRARPTIDLNTGDYHEDADSDTPWRQP